MILLLQLSGNTLAFFQIQCVHLVHRTGVDMSIPLCNGKWAFSMDFNFEFAYRAIDPTAIFGINKITILLGEGEVKEDVTAKNREVELFDDHDT